MAPAHDRAELAGKVAVVTGAGSGLGAAMAHEFAAAGMAVAVLDIDDTNAGKVAAALAEELDVPTTAWRVDVGDPASVEAAARHVQTALGGCDVLCANVGVQQFGAADKLTEQDWEWLLNVNVKGTVRTVREFLPLLRAASGFRRIVFTASSSALAPGVRLAGYQTTKFAVMGFAETLALELRDEGIGVTILFPGGMMTRHLESSALARPTELGPTETAPEDLEAMLAFQPMGERDVVTAEEAVRNLVTDMLDDQLYSLTHGNYRDQYERRRDAIDRAFDRMEAGEWRRGAGIPRSSERGPSGPARSAESGNVVSPDGAGVWLELPPGDTAWDRFVALRPNELGAVADLVVAAWAENDPVLLELCRIRMATALGFTSEQERRTERARAAGLIQEKVADLPSWPTSDRYSPTERAVLALAEQFVMDANAVTEEHVAEVTAHLGPQGCYAFVQAVSVLETFMRACLTLGIDPVPDVDVMAAARDAMANQQEATR